MSRKIISIILTITFLSTVLFGTVPQGEGSIFKTSHLRKAGFVGRGMLVKPSAATESKIPSQKQSPINPRFKAVAFFLFLNLIGFQLFTVKILRAADKAFILPPPQMTRQVRAVIPLNPPQSPFKKGEVPSKAQALIAETEEIFAPVVKKTKTKTKTKKETKTEKEKIPGGEGILDFEDTFYKAEHFVGGGDSIYYAKKRLSNAITDRRKVLYGSIGDLFLDAGKSTDIGWIFKIGAYLTPSKLQKIAVASARVQEAVDNRILTEYLWAVEFTANYQKLGRIQRNLRRVKERIRIKISKGEDPQESEIAIFRETLSRFREYQAHIKKLSGEDGNIWVSQISNQKAVKLINKRLSILVVRLFIRVKIGTWTEEYKDIYNRYKEILADESPEIAIRKAVEEVQAKQGIWQKSWKFLANRSGEGEELIEVVKNALNTSPYLTANSTAKDLLDEEKFSAFLEKFPHSTGGVETGKLGGVWDKFRFGFGVRGSFAKLLFESEKYEIPAAERAKLAFYDNYLKRSFRVLASDYKLNLWKKGEPSLDDELKTVEGELFLKTIGNNLGGKTEDMLSQNIFNGLDEDMREEMEDYLPMDLNRVPSEIWSGKDLLDIALANSPLTYIDAIKGLNSQKQENLASNGISDWWKWGGGIIPINPVPAGGFVLENRGLEEDIAGQAKVLAVEEALENRSLLFINALKTLAEYRYLEERLSSYGTASAMPLNDIKIELKKLKYRWKMLCGGVPLPDMRTINKMLSPGYAERFFKENHIGYASSLSKMSLGIESYGKNYENAVMNKQNKEADIVIPGWAAAASAGAAVSTPPAWLVGYAGVKIVAPWVFPPSADKDAQEMLARKIEQKEKSFKERKRLFKEAQEAFKSARLPRGRTPEMWYKKALIGIEKAAYSAPITVIGDMIHSELDNGDIEQAVSLWFRYNGSSLFDAQGSSLVGERLRYAVNSDTPEAVEFRERIEDYIWDKLGGEGIFSKAVHLWDDKDYKTAQRAYNRLTILGMIFSPKLEQELISNYKHLQLQPGMDTRLEYFINAGNYRGAIGAYQAPLLPAYIAIPRRIAELEKAGKYSDAQDYVREAMKAYEARGGSFERAHPKIAERYDKFYHRYNLFAGRADHYYEMNETRGGTSSGENYRIEGDKHTYLPYYRHRTDSINVRAGMNTDIERNDLYNPFKTDFEDAYGWGSLTFTSFKPFGIQIDPRVSIKPYKDNYRKIASLSLYYSPLSSYEEASVSSEGTLSKFLKLKNLNWWMEADDRGPDEREGYRFYGSESITGNIGLPYSITGTSDLTDIDRYGIEEGWSGEHSVEGSIGTETGLFVGGAGYYHHNRDTDSLVKSFLDQYYGNRSPQITNNYEEAGKYPNRFRGNLWAEYDLRSLISLTQGLWQDEEDSGKYDEWKGIGVIAGRQYTEFAPSKDYAGASYDIGKSGKIAYIQGVNNKDRAAGMQKYFKDGKYFAGASWSSSEITPGTEYQKIDVVLGARGELSPVFRVSLNPEDRERSLTGEAQITAGSSTYGGNIHKLGQSFSVYEGPSEIAILISNSRWNRYYSSNTAYLPVRPRPLWLADDEEGEGYYEYRLRLHLASGKDFRIPGTDLVKKALSKINGSEYEPGESAEKTSVGSLHSLVNYLEKYEARIQKEAQSKRLRPIPIDKLPWKGTLAELSKSIQGFADSADKYRDRIGDLEALQNRRITALQKRLDLEEKLQKAEEDRDSIARKELNAKLKKVNAKIKDIALQEKSFIPDVQELIKDLKEVQTAHNTYAVSRRDSLRKYYKQRLRDFNILANEFDTYLEVSMSILRGFEDISRINTIEQYRSAAERFASLSGELERRFPWMDFTQHIQNLHRRLRVVGRMFEKLAEYERNGRAAPRKAPKRPDKALDEAV